MKIIAFMRGYKPEFNTGAILMTADILEALVAAGHEVTVYSYNDVVQDEVNGVKVIKYDKLNKPQFPKYDLVYTHPDLGSIGPKTVTEKFAPLIGVLHNASVDTIAAVEKHHMRYSLLVYNSEATAKEFEFPGIILHSPMKVADYKVDRRGAKYITLINQSGAKGVELFWKIARRMPEYQFLAVEGPYGVQYVRDTIPNVTNLKFVGHEDVKTIYKQTKVLLTPSTHESWGRVAAEAMCSGIPVVSTPCAGLMECIGENGVFLDCNNVDGWTDELTMLMEDQTYYKKRSTQARARAKQIEVMSTRELDFFVNNLEELCRK